MYTLKASASGSTATTAHVVEWTTITRAKARKKMAAKRILPPSDNTPEHDKSDIVTPNTLTYDTDHTQDESD